MVFIVILDESKRNDVGRTGAKSSGGASWPLRAYQGNPFTKYSKILAPAGILREPFYKIFQNFGPCGHIKGTHICLKRFTRVQARNIRHWDRNSFAAVKWP